MIHALFLVTILAYVQEYYIDSKDLNTRYQKIDLLGQLFMKAIITLFIILVLFGSSSLIGSPDLSSQPPKECRSAGYTCVLKKVAGGYFWCQKTIRERNQRSRQKIRATRRIRCINRFPVAEE